ncbi:MAG: hypothetical protein MJE68_04635 [Proteobacteria bacterium]|nr:hypothetical protein [Pseudomonadota bacterium]
MEASKMAGFPDATERGTSLEQPEYSCGHEVNTALSVYMYERKEKGVVFAQIHHACIRSRANTEISVM